MASGKKTLLITGGLGFIGLNLAKRLSSKFSITIVDFDKSAKEEGLVVELQRSGARIIEADISTPKTWANLPKCNFIFHAAAQVAAELSWEEPELDFQTNVYGSFLTAEYARKHNARVIYCNSIRVYDPDAVAISMGGQGKVSEECPTIDISSKPQPPFAISKHLGEQYFRYFSQMYGVKVISLRMSGVVGPGQLGSKVHGWITNIVRCAVTGEEFTLFGDGNQTRDVLHIADYLDLIDAQLGDFDRFSVGGFGFYNIGGGPANQLSINQVIRILNEEHSLGMTLRHVDPRIGEPRHYLSSLDKIRLKGWPFNPLKSSSEIIREVVDHYRPFGDKTHD